jgi:hypothetical protein
MSNKQTAVDWLEQELKLQFGFAFSNNILNQAKEIEKEQIINAFIDGDSSDCILEQDQSAYAKQYYKYNYGKIQKH